MSPQDEIRVQVKRLDMRARRLVDGAFAGAYRSAFKGRGIDFAEVRPYAFGDDVRSIDWNVTARHDEAYVKRHVEERELTVLLLVDVSASGNFGSSGRTKSTFIAEIAALLASSALRSNDKVGLLLFTDQVERYLPPRRGRDRAARLILELLTVAPRHAGTDLASALEYIRRVAPRHAVTFVISDFIARDYERAVRAAHQRHEIIPVCIHDPCELELPEAGLVAMRDLETGTEILIDTSDPRLRQRYRERAMAEQARRSQIFGSLGLDGVDVRTDQPWIRPLMQFFRRRAFRLSQGR